MAADDTPSSPVGVPSGASLEEELAYYKAQYEQLEVELAEFQASSRELEAELEKDIEASEKRERHLQEKVEGLGFEVDEWKTKYKQSKAEANTAQNTLQKEITNLRDASRTIQLKLRDMEVVNDDFERQARNTTSSLEDLEQKYNQAIERGVMLEEEIKLIEQEREQLRIETQRLRDEMSDNKVEAEIVLERLRLAEETIQRLHDQKPLGLSTETLRPRSPLSETSTSATTLSSPTTSTPPPHKSERSNTSNAPTPPSPPLSEVSASAKNITPTPSAPQGKKSLKPDVNATPRPGIYSSRPPRHSRGPSLPVTSSGMGVGVSNHRSTPSVVRRPPTSRPSITSQADIPRSTSLHQLRGLRTKIQSLEQRVHTVRSKLPAPVSTPPRASPRTGSALGHHSHIPSTVTVRSTKKRPSGSTASSVAGGTTHGAEKSSRQSISRLSFGIPQRPPSALDGRTPGGSRPSSRASVTSQQPAFSQSIGRPGSRAGARTPLQGHFPSASVNTLPRPRSSISGSFGHGHSASVSTTQTDDTESSGKEFVTPMARRTTLGKEGLSGIPTPSGLPRRQSGGPGLRRASSVGIGADGEMKPPPSRGGGMPEGRARKLSEVGETF